MNSSFNNNNNIINSKNENLANSNIEQRNSNTNLKLLSPGEVEEELKKAYELELRKLREHKSNEIDLLNVKKEKDDIIAKLNSKNETLNSYLAEEKNKNGQLLLKIKTLEESFKTLNGE